MPEKTTSIPPAVAAIAPDGRLTPRQRRQIVLGLALRRNKAGTGSAHTFMYQRTALNTWPDLRSLLQGFDWAVIGGVATRAYMPERATKDMDILVRWQDGEAVIQRLTQAGFKIVSRLAVPGYLLQSADGVDLDVLFGRYRWLNEAFAALEQDPAGYPVIGLPYLVLMKMEANRGRDLGDLTTMLGWATPEALARVRQVVKRYNPQDEGDLETLIYLGQREMEDPPADTTAE